MRNASTDAVVPDVRFNFYAAKKGTVKHYAEGLTFGNSGAIRIPAGGDQTLTSEWVVPIDLTLILLTTFDWEHPRARRVDRGPCLALRASACARARETARAAEPPVARRRARRQAAARLAWR